MEKRLILGNLHHAHAVRGKSIRYAAAETADSPKKIARQLDCLAIFMI